MGPKRFYFRILVLVFKNPIVILELAPSNLSNYEISWKKRKFLKLVLKAPYLGIFGIDFENNIVIFEISTL